MRKQPGFTAVVGFTLALGIGANTALFSVLHGVLLRPLPYPEPDEIVLLFEREVDLGWERNGFPPANIRAYQEENETFQAIGAFFSSSTTVTGEGDPERVAVLEVESEVFDALRTRPHLGRLLVPDDEIPGQDRVVVLSYGYWRRRFGADPTVLGRDLRLNGEGHTVVGVLPSDFRPFWGDPSLWAPLSLGEEGWHERQNHFLVGIGRLHPGIDVEQGEADLTTIARRREQAYPDTNQGSLVNVESLQDFTVGGLNRPLWLMMAAAAFVLLIACANVANLFLSRGLAREREFAVRGALGAGRRRLLHLMTTESLLLAVVGGGTGVLLAYLGLEALLALEPGNLPRVESIGINGPVLLFSVLVTLTTCLLFGIIPAVLASTSDLADSLKEASTRSTQSTTPRRLKSTLAVLQMAIAIVLLAGAGLLTRSFVRLQQVDPGFQTANTVQAQISLPGSAYQTYEEVARFHTALVAELERRPNVERAAVVSSPPFTTTPQIFTYIEGREPEGEQPPVVSRIYSSSGYFEVLGVTLLEGRIFDERDRADAPGVVVINRVLAERHFPDESAIGHTLRIGLETSRPMEVIGVVSDVRQYSLRSRPFPAAFIPTSQSPISGFTVVLRGTGEQGGLVSALRSAAQGLDSDLPIYGIRTLDDVIGSNVARPRFAMFLAAVFACVALILSAVGVYGVLAYTVSQRTNEMGIRLALGANRRQVVSLVLRQGMTLTGLALLVGIPSAFALTRTMDSLLYEIDTADPLTFVGLGAGILVAAFVSCYIPAARAGSVSPVRAMRQE
jgi:putative ABC transport system permease protein